MQEINNKLIRASKTYSDNIVLRGLVNLIPAIGGVLDIIFCERLNQITAKQTEDFIEFTKKEFEKVDENKVNKEFINSDDYADLTVRCLSSSIRTRHKEKIKLFAKVLKSAATSENFDLNEFEEILPTFEQVSIRELTVLFHLETWEFNLKNNYIKMLDYSEIRKSVVPGSPGIPVYFGFWDAFVDEVCNKCQLTKEDIEYLLQTSSQKGLFVFGSYDVSQKKTYAARDSFQPKMNGKLTPLFTRMKKYILSSNE